MMSLTNALPIWTVQFRKQKKIMLMPYLTFTGKDSFGSNTKNVKFVSSFYTIITTQLLIAFGRC